MPTTRKRRAKVWSTTIAEHGVEIRVHERKPGGMLYISVKGARRQSASGKWYTEKEVRSLEHDDRELAEKTARAMCTEIANRRLSGFSGSLTFGQLRTQYTLHRAPLLSPTRARTVKTALRLFARHVGADFPLADMDQHRVDTYVAARTSGRLQPDDYRAREKPQAGTVRNELAIVSTACNWATGFRVNGRPLLPSNPLRGLRVPQEENPRRPVAGAERYQKLAAVAHDVDPSGGFALMLAIAWYTGRRINAILHLTAADVLLDQAALVAAFAEAGQDDRIAEAWPGGLRWRAQWDKKGYETFSPLPAALRPLMTAFMRQQGVIGGAWLFPAADGKPAAQKNGERPLPLPVNKARADYLLRKAERAAGLTRQTRGGWHAFRRGWATLRKSMPVQDVMAAGGWRDPAALQTAYQAADSRTVLSVVDLAV